MPSPRTLLKVVDEKTYSFYEILFSQPSTILRVTKFTIDAQVPRNVRYDELSEEVKEKILDEIRRYLRSTI